MASVSASLPADGGALTGLAGQWRRRRQLAFGLLGLLAIAALLLALVQGAVAVPWPQLPAILGGVEGADRMARAVLLEIRAPRALLGFASGAALAACGAALQGLFRNPLADPGLIGVSTGAALGAGLAIVAGGALGGALPAWLLAQVLPLAAFLGALLATVIVYRIATREGHTAVATLLLAGVALNAIAGAAMGLLVFVSDDQQLRDLNLWLLGSLSGVTWRELLPALPLIVAPLALMPWLARALNALLLGETEARHLGFDSEAIKRRTVLLTALAVGASVALTGVIGFVGLVVPHLIRLCLGPDHRVLLPASMLLGGALLLLADLGARTLVLPAELPIGVLTSLIGGPFFLWLLMRRRGAGLS